jgi:hypothetical protein
MRGLQLGDHLAALDLLQQLLQAAVKDDGIIGHFCTQSPVSHAGYLRLCRLVCGELRLMNPVGSVVEPGISEDNTIKNKKNSAPFQQRVDRLVRPVLAADLDRFQFSDYKIRREQILQFGFR